METRVALWTLALCALVGYWFYANSRLEIDYERHAELIDKATGAIHKPSEFLDLAKIIDHKPAYINSSNAIERLYDLAYLSNFENPFVIDQSYSRERDLRTSGWPVANRSRCSNQLDWILGRLNGPAANYSSLRGQLGYELTNFMDSFGRPETGLFSGSIHWLGSHKNCLRAHLDGGQIRTRYCIIKMRFKSWPKEENAYPASRVRAGICLPESCDTLAYTRASSREQINQLARFDLPEKLKDDLEMEALFCLPDERSPVRRIPPAGRIFLVALGAWLALVLAATTIYETLIRHDLRGRLVHSSPLVDDLKSQKMALAGDQAGAQTAQGLLERAVCALSIRNSIKAFKSNAFRVNYNQGQRVRLNLGALDSSKVIMTVLVVLAHACYLGTTHMRSIGNRIESSTGEAGLMAMTLGRCVDTFFLFFGILTSYNLLKKFNERQLANPLAWLAVNVGILARIGPLFVFVYCYSKLLAPYTSSGPWWDYGVDKMTMKGVCLDEPWWKAIPYLGGAGRPSVPACNLPSWFIVSYSQLSLMMPLITYLICKLPGRLARCALVGMLLFASAGSIGLRLAQQTTVREEGFTLYGGFLADLLEKFESTGHLTTLGRLGAASLGCFVGHLLWRYEEGQISSWPKWATSIALNVAAIIALLAMILLPIVGHRVYLLTGKMATWSEFVISNMLLIILWPIACSLLVISVTTKYNHKVWTRFLSHSFWHVFNRLGLAIFLIHWEILYMVITGFEQAPSHGFIFDLMKFWATGVFFAIVFALPIHILIEAPASNLLMVVFRHYTSEYLAIPSAASKHLQAQQKQQHLEQQQQQQQQQQQH